MKTKTYTKLALLSGSIVAASLTANASTLAHWNFEQDLVDLNIDNGGTLGHTSGAGVFQAAASDTSSNSNALSAWNSANSHGLHSTDISGTNQTGSTRSIQNGDGFFGLFTDGDLKVSGTDVGTLSVFTIEASVKFSSLGGYQTVVGKDGLAGVGSTDPNQSLLYLNKTSGNAFGFTFNDGSGGSATISTADGFVSADTWYHLVAVQDGADISLYVDGVLQATAASTVDLGALNTAGNDVWSVGRGMYNSGHGDRVDGFIDDVRISDTALTSNQFLQAVPEPSSAALLGIGGLTLLLRRKK